MTRLLKWWRSLPLTSRVGISIVLVLCVVAIFAPWLAPYDPSERVTTPFAKPSFAHPLGADDVGRDLLSLLIYGARPSLLVGFIAAVGATAIGMAVGITAGYLRGAIDTVLMRVVDIVMALPVVPLTLVVGVLAGPGIVTQIFVISIALWAPMARELRAQVLSVRERDYIHALRSMGARNGYVLTNHVVPAVAVLVVPQLVLAVKSAVLLEASLAFLGLGDINSMSWGMMLSLASQRSAFLTDAWLWWVIPPGAMIGLTVLGFALAGGAVERVEKLGRRTADDAPAAMTPDTDTDALLVIDQLTVRYGAGEGSGGCTDVSLSLRRGQSLGLVGESGSGKSTVAAFIVGLADASARVRAGSIQFDGTQLLSLPKPERRRMLGERIALIPQEAQSALNPVQRVGTQIIEAIRAHEQVSKGQARQRAQELLAAVGLPASAYAAFPHQLSGGQRQRAVIAIALSAKPDLLVADEPTSGLDVLIQHEIIELLGKLRKQMGLTLVIVTHDLPVVTHAADQLAVMQDGRVVEQGAVSAVLANPQHQCTQRLLNAIPDMSEFDRSLR